MGNFEDYAVAMRTRDAISRIAEGLINTLRPEPKIGEVFSFDSTLMVADILFPSDTQPVRVKIGRGQIPFHTKMDDGIGDAAGDLVRVQGRMGSYYVIQNLDSVDGNPVSTILNYGGDTAPPGYLLCQGAFVNKTDYAALFLKIGHLYNAGVDPADGTFKLPDLRDRAPVGKSGTKALGAAGGNASKVITTAEMPAHTHAIDHDHAAQATTSDAHEHTFGVEWSVDVPQTGAARRVVNVANTTGGAGTSSATAHTSSDSHSHTLNLPNFTGTSGSAGAGGALDIQNPYQAVNFIIKY